MTPSSERFSLFMFCSTFSRLFMLRQCSSRPGTPIPPRLLSQIKPASKSTGITTPAPYPFSTDHLNHSTYHPYTAHDRPLLCIHRTRHLRQEARLTTAISRTSASRCISKYDFSDAVAAGASAPRDEAAMLCLLLPFGMVVLACYIESSL